MGEPTKQEIQAVYPTVAKTIADALGCDVDQVKLDVSLIEGLDAESIDFLDLVFRLERAFKIKIPRGKIVEDARGDLMRPEARDVLAVEDDRAAGRPKKAAQQVEAGGLAGPVGANQADDLALVDGEVDAVDGRQPAEEPRELTGLEEGHEVRPPGSA